MAKTLQQVNKENANLRKANKELLAQHVKDSRRIKELEEMNQEIFNEISDVYSVWMKSIVEQHGEPVFDDDSFDIIGKRFEFQVEKSLNRNRFNMSEGPPDDEEKYLAKITLGVTYPTEEGE